MTTLKELKKEFSEQISTSGSIYYIDGQGWYKQRKTAFGIETYTRNRDGEWTAVSFEELVKDMYNLYR